MLTVLPNLDFFGAIFPSQNPHVVMQNPTISVGQGRQCDLCLGDPTVSRLLCNLKHLQSEVCRNSPLVNLGLRVSNIMLLTDFFACLSHFVIATSRGSQLHCLKLLAKVELSKLMERFSAKMPLSLYEKVMR